MQSIIELRKGGEGGGDPPLGGERGDGEEEERLKIQNQRNFFFETSAVELSVFFFFVCKCNFEYILSSQENAEACRLTLTSVHRTRKKIHYRGPCENSSDGGQGFPTFRRRNPAALMSRSKRKNDFGLEVCMFLLAWVSFYVVDDDDDGFFYFVIFRGKNDFVN